MRMRSVAALQADQRQLFVSHLSTSARSIHEFDGHACAEPVPWRGWQRVAVAFGNEHRGASGALLAAADASFVIPMVGFTSSLNISVACGMSLAHFLRVSTPTPLSPDVQEDVLARWLVLKVLRAKEILGAAGVHVPDL